jgi:Tfp pilus assembly protein PilO
MDNARLSVKRVLIGRANSAITTMLALAVVSVVVCLTVSYTLIAHIRFRSKVVTSKKAAAKVLKQNSQAADQLVKSFQAFDSAPESLIGTKDKNSKIVLDALPSKYDFPALAASLEKILTDGGYSISSLTGIDNEVTVVQGTESSPQPIDMPFSLSISGPYDKVIQVVADLERSIRPIIIDTLDLSGTSTDAKLSITARTYYQPGIMQLRS